MLNITQIAQLTPQTFIIEAHNTTAIPLAILLYILFHVIFVVVGLVMTKNREKLYQIVLISLIFNAILLLAGIFLPHVIQNIWNFFV